MLKFGNVGREGTRELGEIPFRGFERRAGEAMTDDIKLCFPPMLTLLGTLIVVTFTACLNTRVVGAKIDALNGRIDGLNGRVNDVKEMLGNRITDMKETLGNQIADTKETLRAESRATVAELTVTLQRIENKLDHYAETQAGHSEDITRLKERG